jgi:tRNA-dihydrouridine synthase C
MEGITDEAYRKTILKLNTEWDVLATDFLRVPASGKYPNKHVVRHFGKELFASSGIQNKTMFQILTSHRSFTVDLVKQLEDLGVPWLDMNIGCPSNTVCKSQGGSYLLRDLPALAPLVRSIRQNFSGRFTCKIRIGYSDTSGFEDSIRLLNDEGAELITVHARTRDDMYKAPARWSFIGRAVQISQVPVIGNGDVWGTADVNRMMDETGCHGVMVARGALKAPWLAQDYRKENFYPSTVETAERIREFFGEYRATLEAENVTPRGVLKQSKSVARFMVDDFEDGALLRRKLMLSQSVSEFYDVIFNLLS